MNIFEDLAAIWAKIPDGTKTTLRTAAREIATTAVTHLADKYLPAPAVPIAEAAAGVNPALAAPAGTTVTQEVEQAAASGFAELINAEGNGGANPTP